MAYAFVQALGNENNAAGVTTVATGNLPGAQTAGNTNIVVVYYEGANTTVTISDTLGGAYTERGTELTDGGTRRMRLFDRIGISAGTNSVTATFGAARDFPAIYCAEYSGLSAFDVQAKQTEATPGTGTDAVDSSAATVTAQPALQFGFTFNAQLLGTPNPGTGFTGRTAPSWDYGGTNTAAAEDRRLTSTGSSTATFTATNNSLHMTLQAVYTESGAAETFMTIPTKALRPAVFSPGIAR